MRRLLCADARRGQTWCEQLGSAGVGQVLWRWEWGWTWCCVDLCAPDTSFSSASTPRPHSKWLGVTSEVCASAWQRVWWERLCVARQWTRYVRACDVRSAGEERQPPSFVMTAGA